MQSLWQRLVLGILAACSGCAICANPHDCKFAAYGGKIQRQDRVHGRVGSLHGPQPVNLGTNRNQQVTPDRSIGSPLLQDPGIADPSPLEPSSAPSLPEIPDLNEEEFDRSMDDLLPPPDDLLNDDLI